MLLLVSPVKVNVLTSPIEENKGIETELKTVDGMQFDRGYVSAYFVTDSERMETVFEDPYILIHEKKISSMRELIKLLEQLKSEVQRERRSDVLRAADEKLRDAAIGFDATHPQLGAVVAEISNLLASIGI